MPGKDFSATFAPVAKLTTACINRNLEKGKRINKRINENKEGQQVNMTN